MVTQWELIAQAKLRRFKNDLQFGLERYISWKTELVRSVGADEELIRFLEIDLIERYLKATQTYQFKPVKYIDDTVYTMDYDRYAP